MWSKSVPFLGMLLVLILLTGCATTGKNQAMSPEEHAFACTAVQTLLRTGLTSTLIHNAPQQWRQNAPEVLLPAEGTLLVDQSRQIPGLEQHIRNYLDLVAQSVSLLLEEWLNTIEHWIDDLVIIAPFEIISGSSSSATTYFSDHYRQELIELISTTLAESNRQDNQKVLQAWQRVEERYQIYARAENLLQSNSIPYYQTGEIFNSLGTTIATALLELMSIEEMTIRATSSAYNDPCLKLFTTNGR